MFKFSKNKLLRAIVAFVSISTIFTTPASCEELWTDSLNKAAQRSMPQSKIQTQTQITPNLPDNVIRIAMLDFEGHTTYSSSLDRVQASIIDYLIKQFPGYSIEVRFLTTQQLIDAVKNAEVEFFLASSGFYVSMLPYGIRDIATLISNQFTDPNRVVAGTMFVRRDRKDLTNLDSLQGKKAVSTHPLNFMTYQINMAELAIEGYDPDEFFKSIQFTNNDPKGVMESVLNGTADVGLLRHCMLEGITSQHPEFTNQFKVINPKNTDCTTCAASTDYYPGWTMAVTPHTPPEMARALALALFSMPAKATPSGYTWAIATDFKRVNNVLKLLRIGPYSYLRHWTLKDALVFAWPYLFFIAGLLTAGFLHFLRVKKLVAKRTAELSEALIREREADERSRETSNRLESLQRVSAIGQLSSIFVHELGQPLSAMRYSVRGIETLIKRLTPTIQSPQVIANMDSCIQILRRQLDKSAEIIDRVRSYAKQGDGREDLVNLCETINETVLELKDARKLPSTLDLDIPAYPIIVKGNRVELKLVVLNLIKNATEEITEQKNGTPMLLVTLDTNNKLHQAILTVENSGRTLTTEEIDRLREPLKTSKHHGLGLGIMIITSIAEAHRARIQFLPRTGGGLIARFNIDLFEDTEKPNLADGAHTEFGDKF